MIILLHLFLYVRCLIELTKHCDQIFQQISSLYCKSRLSKVKIPNKNRDGIILKNFQFLFAVSILEKMVKVLAHCIGSLECYSLELKNTWWLLDIRSTFQFGFPQRKNDEIEPGINTWLKRPHKMFVSLSCSKMVSLTGFMIITFIKKTHSSW